MSTDWTIFLASLLFLALVFFLYRLWRHTNRTHERDFNASTDMPIVIGRDQWEELTQRQQQVARLAARGLSNTEIAQQLGVKPNTIDAHLKKIYTTLDVHSRAELGYRIKDHID